jgi:HK97 family phage portal protein
MGILQYIQSFFGPPTNNANLISDGEARWYGVDSPMAAGTAAGETVSQASLMTSATCFACTKALAETVAGLPGLVYRQQSGLRIEDENQLAYELLSEQPNPEMDAFTFWDLAVSRIVNRGNFFCEIQRDGADRPIALWPIHNTRVKPMRDSDGSLFFEVANDFSGSGEYDDPSWRKQNLRFLSPHNMFNIVGFGSTNGIIAPGMIPASQEVAMDFATRRYGGSFFASGAKPAGMVTHPGFIQNEGQRNQFREDLNRIHSGAANAHKIGVLWHGATYSAVGIAPEQAQFLETRKFTSGQLCKFYGVPPAIIGDYEDSKFATADAMIRAFVMLTVRNLVVRIEKAVNRQILNVRDSNGRLQRAFTKPLIYSMAIDGLLRGDPKTQAETHRVYRELGILSGNEIRQEIGFNPMQGPQGDYVIVTGGMARLEKIDDQGTRSATREGSDDTGTDEDAKLPTFDRERLAAMIAESGLATEPVAQVRGADVASEILTETAVDLAVSAATRIHKIAHTQIERWREQDPAEVASKLEAFWTKQDERLREALEPASKVASKVKDESNLTEFLAAKYKLTYSRLDNYQIFDSTRTVLFDVAQVTKEYLA